MLGSIISLALSLVGIYALFLVTSKKGRQWIRGIIRDEIEIEKTRKDKDEWVI